MEASKEEEIRTVKQMYLRREIVSKRYDTERFVAFCKSKKNGGEEIDHWTLEELQEIVVEFKLKYNELGKQPESEQVDHSTPPDDDEEINDVSSVSSFDYDLFYQEKTVGDMSSNFDQSQFPIDSFMRSTVEAPERRRSTIDLGVKARTQLEMSDISVTTTCRALVRGKISLAEDAKIAVVDAKIEQGGFFSPNFVSYEIRTDPLNWIVRRRYSDFQWLRSILKKTFPGYIIPPIPEKQTSGRFKEDFIEYRRVFFSYFLASILQNEIFRRSSCVEVFLSIVDVNLFKTRKKEFIVAEGPKTVEDFYTLDGEMKLKVTEASIDYIEVFPTFLSQFETQLQKSAVLSRQLSEDYERVASTLKQMAECFGDIHAVNQATFKNEMDPMRQIFGSLSSVTNMWGVTYEENTSKINENFSEFFTYAACEIPSVRELIKRYQMYKAKYYSILYRLISRKEKLFASKEISRWELSSEDQAEWTAEQLLDDKDLAFTKMLYNETLQAERARLEYAFFTHQTHEELKRTKIEYLLKYRDHFTKTAHDESAFIAKLHVMWADLISNLSVYSNIKAPEQIPSKDSKILGSVPTLGSGPSSSSQPKLKKGVSEPIGNQPKRKVDEYEEPTVITKRNTDRN